MTRVVAVVQARMGSSRLPGKVLAPLGETTVLDWVVQRVLRAGSVDDLVVATSGEESDDALADHALSRGYSVARGSLHDVLDRVHSAVLEARAEHVVRVTADCPLVDPQVLDDVVAAHLAQKRDFTANRLPPPHRRTYPIGLDVEVATAAALDLAWSRATSPHEREHVMPYLYEVVGRFDVHVVNSAIDAGSVRWTVDTREDLAAVQGLVAAANAGYETSWLDLLAVWQARPDLQALNADVVQKTATDTDERA